MFLPTRGSLASLGVAMTRLLLTLLISVPLLAAAVERPNLIVILSDDHRYDFMGFMEGSPAFLETPNLDRMAKEGAHLQNAFVSTSLCSPSRASILTGQYMHHHRVVDNQRPVPDGTRFFPSTSKQAGYQTAFIGKWHMGHENDEPRRGFDHWVSFRGQGTYFDPELNINGQRVRREGYTADVLTDQALAWLKGDGRGRRSPVLAPPLLQGGALPLPASAAASGRYGKSRSTTRRRWRTPRRTTQPTPLDPRAPLQHPRDRPHGDRRLRQGSGPVVRRTLLALLRDRPRPG